MIEWAICIAKQFAYSDALALGKKGPMDALRIMVILFCRTCEKLEGLVQHLPENYGEVALSC